MKKTNVAATASVLAACAGVARAQSFTEGFEAGAIPATWTVHNQSQPGPGTFQWQAGITANAFAPHTGTYYAIDSYNAGTGVSTLSDWLITPQVNPLSDGDVLSFWTRMFSTQFPDRMQVRLSTAGASVNTGATATDTGDFGTLLVDINPTYSPSGYPVVWTQYNLPLSSIPAASSGRFAFRYFVEDGGPSGVRSNVIGVDDVAYTAAGVPGGCYANCDGSTTSPVLNVLDLTCFLQKYAGSDPYANCDGSTTSPVLNVLDFTCFLQKYAAGCL